MHLNVSENYSLKKKQIKATSILPGYEPPKETHFLVMLCSFKYKWLDCNKGTIFLKMKPYIAYYGNKDENVHLDTPKRERKWEREREREREREKERWKG